MFSVSRLPTTTPPHTSDDNSTEVNPEHTLPNFAITTDEFLKAFQSLKTNESPEPDKVYAMLLKEIKSEISPPSQPYSACPYKASSLLIGLKMVYDQKRTRSKGHKT